MTALNEAALAAAKGDDERGRERSAETRLLLDENEIVLDPDDASEFAALASRFS
jgi:hypothetical protein